MLIDTHCHLYLPEFDADLEKVLKRAYYNGVQKIFLPAIDSETHERLIQLAEYEIRNPESGIRILPMMGLHPCSVKENFEDELKIVAQFFDSGRQFFAVGEIGLDYHWDISFQKEQVIVFERQIELAIEKKLPIVIHSRKSTYDCIKSVKKFKGRVNGIFHCFSGSLEEAREIVNLGFYLGIGGVVTYKNSGLKDILPEIGLSHLVLETDSPYLPPVPHRGKRNEPSYTKIVAETLAQMLGKSLDEVINTTTRNALTVFQLKD